MTHKTYPTDIAEQGRAVLEAWRQIDPAVQLGGMALADLEASLGRLGELYAQLTGSTPRPPSCATIATSPASISGTASSGCAPG